MKGTLKELKENKEIKSVLEIFKKINDSPFLGEGSFPFLPKG